MSHNRPSLKPHHTFGFDVSCETLCEFNSEAELITLQSTHQDLRVIGEGSNIVFTKDYPGCIAINRIPDIEVTSESDNDISLRVGAGVNWHAFVCFCTEHGYGGVENLALIPGSVGAAPIQNIGAYGAEVKSTITHVETIDRITNKKRIFQNHECEFTYRDSVFKSKYRNKLTITYVTFTLSKSPSLKLDYPLVKETLASNGITQPSIQHVADAICEIRRNKLPDPKIIGNAGSFFKNPTIDKSEYDRLKQAFANLPGYPVSDNKIKVPAAYLIEHCGWKGHQESSVGVHEHQALVLINHGSGKSDALIELANKIQATVQETFGIHLEPEVQLI